MLAFLPEGTYFPALQCFFRVFHLLSNHGHSGLFLSREPERLYEVTSTSQASPPTFS